MSALPPILLAFAVFDDWYQTLIIIAGFGITDLIVASLLEPVVFGHATGVTPLGVLFSSALWAWLWGPVGLILATPISVSLVVLGRYVPELRLLGVLFADGQQLSSSMRLYQRVLAGDFDEARTVIAGERASEPDRVKIASTVFLPSMVASVRDYRRGRLTQERFRQALSLFTKLTPAVLDSAATEESTVSDRGREMKVALCTLGGHQAEQLLLEPISAFLEERSFKPETISYKLLTGEVLSSIGRGDPKVIFLSMLPLLTGSFTRYRFKRISRRFPDVPIVLGVWSDGDRGRYERYFHHRELRFASTYEEALQEIERAATTSPAHRSAVG